MYMKEVSNEAHISTISKILDLLESDSISSSNGWTWLANDISSTNSGMIGPDLYNGMAGMALTFSAFYQLTGNQKAREISYNCILHSLDNADQIPAGYRFGFFNGWSGMIYSAILINKLFNDDKIYVKAINLMNKLAKEPYSNEYDIMAGTAGTVSGLTLVSPILGAPALNLAIRAAERLLHTSKPVKELGSKVLG